MIIEGGDIMRKSILLIFLLVVLLTGCENSSQNESNDKLNNIEVDIVYDSEVDYDSGIYYNKNWDETIGTYTMPVIRDRESAIEIAMAIYNSMENNNPNYVPQSVFFDEEDEIWIVSFWEASYEGLGNCCSIALQKKDGRVLRIWAGE